MHRVVDALFLRVARARHTFDCFDRWMNLVDKDVGLRFGHAICSHTLHRLLLDRNASRERHVNDLNFLPVRHTVQVEDQFPDRVRLRGAGSLDVDFELVPSFRAEDHHFEQEWFADLFGNGNDTGG